MKFINRMVKALLAALGFEVRRTRYIPPSPEQVAMRQLAASMDKFAIDLVLDVGANIGQFASALRNSGYGGAIVSFEPLSAAHQQLTTESASDPRWAVHPRCALGDFDGEVEINIAGNSQSSSILPMMESHRAAAPESEYTGREGTPLYRLDTAATRYLQDAQAPFLKIDTQGFEWQVLDGARDALPRIRGIMVEMSLVPLYDGQRLWREMVDRLEEEGFALWSLRPAFTDPATGRTLQVDGIFFRIPQGRRADPEPAPEGSAR